MSGRAVGLILRYGPRDPDLMALCVVVADTMDASGHNGRIGLRLIAEHARTSYGTAFRLRDRAVAEGWLAVENPGDARHRATYGLGPTVAAERSAAIQIRIAAIQNPTWNRAPAIQTPPDLDHGRKTVSYGVTSDAPLRSEASLVSSDPPPRVALHPPSCVCAGSGWVEADTEGRSVDRCPGPTATTDDERPDP